MAHQGDNSINSTAQNVSFKKSLSRKSRVGWDENVTTSFPLMIQLFEFTANRFKKMFNPNLPGPF